MIIQYILLLVLNLIQNGICGYWRESYDYIIVGGGGAGCVLARRLSEDPDVTVLLLEAGPDDYNDPFMSTPKTFIAVIQNKKYDWEFFTQPQPNLPDKRKLGIAQAKVLGGCTSHNGMNVVRGSRHDYDRWAELGNDGWSYDDVLPYFKKAEDMTDERLKDSEYHGTGGVWTTRMTYDTPFLETFIKAGQELGYDEVDYNGESQFGFGRLQNSIDARGHRMSTSSAYLRPVIMRRNLDVVLEAFVTKINMDNGDIPKATGVSFVKDGVSEYVSVKKEIILSCGPMNGPKLLMLSGIGPKNHLEKHGIHVLADLPVGNSLEDHIAFHFPFWLEKDPPLKHENTLTFDALFEYLIAGTGPWTTICSEGTAFFRSDLQPETDKMPYLEVPMAIDVWGMDQNLVRDLRSGKGASPELVQKMVKRELGPIGISSASILYHARSKGTVRLRSTNPLDKPVIVKNYFEHPDDIKDLIQGIRIAQKIANTTVMRNAGVKPLSKYDQECKMHSKDSDEFWECMIKNGVMSFAHFAGTCRMAPDETGVLDNRLRVKGVSGLRVVDSSIMPNIMSGHGMAPTIMIAEKASDMIKEDATTI